MSTRKKWGLFLMILPFITIVLRFLNSTIFYFINILISPEGVDALSDQNSLLSHIKVVIDWVLGVLMLIGIPGFVGGIILFVMQDKKNSK